MKHGLSYTSEYRAWQTMRLRCTNPRHAAWKDYGGRGITVCDRWRDDPAAFLADMGPKPSPRHELDRIDNNRGYQPGNCRWVVRSANCRNRRSSRYVEFHGQRRLMIELCTECEIPFDTASYRLRRGWTPEATFETPVREKAPNGCSRGANRPNRVTRSGVRGIDWQASKQRWRVRVQVDGRRKEMRFRTLEEAKEALVRANLPACARAAEAG